MLPKVSERPSRGQEEATIMVLRNKCDDEDDSQSAHEPKDVKAVVKKGERRGENQSNKSKLCRPTVNAKTFPFNNSADVPCTRMREHGANAVHILEYGRGLEGGKESKFGSKRAIASILLRGHYSSRCAGANTNG